MLVTKMRGIKSSLELSTLREIKKYIDEILSELKDYKYKNSIDELKELQIYKLCLKIENTDIFDLRYKDIEKYIDELITILDFIEIKVKF